MITEMAAGPGNDAGVAQAADGEGKSFSSITDLKPPSKVEAELENTIYELELSKLKVEELTE